MRKISAVIGANYGDEGKGLITDYLASRSNSLVVRFNGGAQAGHTVVAPNGKRHIFHHFGSGTLTGAATFLSKHFIAHPMAFRTEREELHKKGFNPVTYASIESFVTTPYDLMLNQAAEAKRGDSRHGSCGMGINETVVREQMTKYSLQVGDLSMGRYTLSKHLEKIRDEYVPVRAQELGIELSKIPYLMNDILLSNFLDDCEYFTDHVTSPDWDLFEWEGDIIFEGAQGLKLDMDSRDFPHVTRSKTGLHNVVELIKSSSIKEDLDVYYVTRPYLTRHGAGPLRYEKEKKLLPQSWKIEDLTNTPNLHQGSLRYGLLDMNDVISTVTADLKSVELLGRSIKPLIAVTCLDQVGPLLEFIKNGELTRMNHSYFTSELMLGIRANFALSSFGPTRNHVLLN